MGKTLRAPPPRLDSGGSTTFCLRSAKNKKSRRTIPMPPLLLTPSDQTSRGGMGATSKANLETKGLEYRQIKSRRCSSNSCMTSKVWVGRPSYPETQILRYQRGWKFTLFHLPSAILGCKLGSAWTRMDLRPNDAAKFSKLNSDAESIPPRPLAEDRQDSVFSGPIESPTVAKLCIELMHLPPELFGSGFILLVFLNVF